MIPDWLLMVLLAGFPACLFCAAVVALLLPPYQPLVQDEEFPC
ncbi:hypothetical protein ACIBF5_09670 [Micromonospora sp. NPDC050417]